MILVGTQGIKAGCGRMQNAKCKMTKANGEEKGWILKSEMAEILLLGHVAK
jgi:hypothetical protein